jgi:tetratricopeptide (TPR) repeat protein/serine/threonine protein kinase
MNAAWSAGDEPVTGYRLTSRLGRGGYGEVWEAEGPGAFRVALKFVPLTEPVGNVELRSIQIVREIRHPHLLATFGAWEVDGHLIVAMERAERTLLDRFREAVGQGFQGIPDPEIHEHFLDAAKGIDYLNEPRHPSGSAEPQGIQHRDIKPQNLLLLGGSVKVADYGLARVLGHSQTGHTGSMTPAYAAPEFFKNKTSSQSDQYSLAVTYCHLRGGQLPFNGSFEEIMFGHLTKDPDLSMIPENERDAVARSLSKTPRDRWPTCRALVEAVRGHSTAVSMSGTGFGAPAQRAHGATECWGPGSPKVDGSSHPTPRSGLARGDHTPTIPFVPQQTFGTNPVPPDPGPGPGPGGKKLLIRGLAVIAVLGLTFACFYAVHSTLDRSPVVTPITGKTKEESKGGGTSGSTSTRTEGSSEALTKSVTTRPPTPKLELQIPPSITIGLGETTTFVLKAERTALDGPVLLRYGGLPQGLSIRESSIPGNAAQITVLVRSDLAMPVRRWPIAISASCGTVSTRGLLEIATAESSTSRAESKSHVQKAVEHLKARQYDAAKSEFNRAIALDSHNVDAFLGRSQAYVDSNQFDEAISDCETLFGLQPENAKSRAVWGFAWARKKDFPKAFKGLDKALELDKNDAATYRWRASVHVMQGQWKLALADAEKAIGLDEKDAASHRIRAFALEKLPNHEAAALRAYDTAIQLDDQVAEAFCARGDLLSLQKEYAKAIKDYTRAIALDQKIATTFNSRGHARYLNEEFQAAIDDYDSAIKLKPDYAVAIHNRGNAWSALGKYDKALGDYNTAILLNTKDPSAYSNRGLAWYQIKDYEKAIDDYTTAISLKPNFLAHVYRYRGDAYKEQALKEGKAYDKALKDYAEAIKIDKNYIYSYMNRAEIWRIKKEHELRMKDYDKVIELKPSFGEARAFRGRLKLFLNDVNGAIPDLELAIRNKYITADVYSDLGDARRLKGDLAGARREYDKALEIDPDEAGAYVNRGYTWLKEKSYIKAVRDFTEAIERYEELAAAYRNPSFVRSPESDEKRREVTTNLATAYRNRSRAHIAQGNKVQAEKDTAQARQLETAAARD